jgi:hypothetical protein
MRAEQDRDRTKRPARNDLRGGGACFNAEVSMRRCPSCLIISTPYRGEMRQRVETSPAGGTDAKEWDPPRGPAGPGNEG